MACHQSLSISICQAKIVPSLAIEHVKDSIYGYISDKLKLTIHSANLRITIVNANVEEADYLSVPIGEHLVNVAQNAYLDNGQIFEYSVARHICDSYEFSTTYVKSDTQL